MRRTLYLYTILCALVASVWLVTLPIHGSLGIDFFPLFFGGTSIRAGLSPYGAEATARLGQVWQAPFAEAGVAYPLPLLLLIVPLTLLPFAVAAGVWMLAGAAGSFAALRLSPSWRGLILLPLLFLPFHRSVGLGQATLLWFALASALVLSVRARKPWAVGILCTVLLLKPQNGLFFALAGLVWAGAAERRALVWFAGAGAALALVSFLVQPGWLGAWLAQIQVYGSIVRPPSLLPLGLLVLAACWRLPWWALVAAAQVVLFPLSDVYSALPLLLCWIAVGGPLALAGAGLSWVWSLGGLPNTVEVFWGLLLVPLMLAALWRAWRPAHPPAVHQPPAAPDESRQQPHP